jgi:hypothetical protein
MIKFVFNLGIFLKIKMDIFEFGYLSYIFFRTKLLKFAVCNTEEK